MVSDSGASGTGRRPSLPPRNYQDVLGSSSKGRDFTILNCKLQPGFANGFMQGLETRNPPSKWTFGCADVLRHEPSNAKQGFQLTGIAEVAIG